MKDFEFYNPVRILFGKDKLPKMAELIPAGKKIILIYGGGSIKRNGVYDRVMATLAGRKVTEFGGIEPNPSYETCMKAVEKIKAEKAEYIVAAGGGSVIDAAKFIAAAAVYTGGDPWDILSKEAPVTAALPLATVLTLPATGTEMNKNAVISRKSTVEKLAFISPFVFPQFSVLLPDAAASLPKHQVANGIVDAFIHTTEQYLNYPVNAPIQDRFAEAVLKTLVEEGPKVYANPADYETMSNLYWSATMALNGLLSCGVPGDWSVHDIGHELTALHNIDHACTLAIVLPGILTVLKEEKKGKLIQYGERVWNITGGTEDERADRAIALTEKFFRSLGVKTRLGEYGVGADTIGKVVDRLEKRNWIAFGDRKLVTPDIVRRVLESRL
ncbi:MAG: iron-containing alcohol dehydrogenase [Bacteroidales bacterium]|jgi:NADP-dependent alcohol dehydrogenase|nr:iron-containing alcohol dehydrogenase [Bacteroidales bacterium]